VTKSPVAQDGITKPNDQGGGKDVEKRKVTNKIMNEAITVFILYSFIADIYIAPLQVWLLRSAPNPFYFFLVD